MYGTKAAFDYITVGGRCAYETNKVFEFPAQTFHACSCLHTTEHDNILCTFMDTLSYVEILFGAQIESAKYYMLRLVYFAKNVNSLNLNITWKKEGDPIFCGECYEHVIADVSSNKFLYVDIDLRQNSEWVGNITNLRVGVYNTEIVPLFIRYLSVYSPTTYKCLKQACPYYSNYSTPCGAGKDLHILSGTVFEENSINIVSNSSFSFTVYDIDFVVEIDSNNYFLNNILNEINEFFKTMPVPGLSINLDENRIKLTCNYTKPIIKHTEISEKLGFFDAFGNDISTYIIENSGNSDYIDIAGNLKGVYKTTNLKDLNFSKTFSVGFKDDGDMAPGAMFDFLDQTVIFNTLVIQFDGYINCFEIYCKALSGGGKILIFRRNGDTYTIVNSCNINPTTYMEKQVIDWPCNVYKGDVIGVYNLKLYISKKVPDLVNHYGVVGGYSSSINKTSIENVSFSAVSLYAYFKQPTANDIPIVATYNEAAYVDRVSFSLEYDDLDLSFFNVIYNNTFNHEITGCQINVKDPLNVVTEVPGEIIDLGCLSNGTFFATEADFQLDISDVTPPIILSSTKDRDVLRYSWAEIITGMYENNNYTYTFIAGGVFFYYEFPTTIDICKVNLYSEEEESVDNYLLKVLDNTKTSPSFSNIHDVIILDTQIKSWVFDIEGCISTKGMGVFVYNYGELPNISFAEIELYTNIGGVPEYIIEVTATTHDDYVVPFGLDINGTRNNAYIGSHIKNLTFNIGFITGNMLFDFSDINIYSSYVPDDYFVSESNSGEGTLKIYNTRSKALKCYLLDYNIDLLNNLIYEYDFDNSTLHRGFVPTRYIHDVFYFISSNYLNDKYTTYILKNLINTEDFFITKSYNFNSQEYDDWYAPYDYLVPGHDGQFVYIDGGLTLKPLGSEAIRWFNYINTNEFYNDIDIELRFDYVGNMEDFVFIGITCCDRDYNNYLKFYGAFQFSPEYGLEFQLEGEPEPTYYKFSAILGRDAGLKINKRGSSWTFLCFYSGEWHELTTFSLFDTEVLISISTLFNAPAVEGNVIAEFKSCNINASKIIHGKKVWYTVNDGLNYVYGGGVLDNSTILDNISKPLTFPREYTVKKFIYDFNTLSTRYLKFVNTQAKSIKITEIKCYLDDVLVPIKQGLVSYSDDLFFGTLEGETDHLDDNVIINESFSESICKGADDVLSAVGVEFNSNVGVNKTVVYYVSETGSYEPCRLMYSYDNIVYYDVYDNFSLFSENTYTTAHYLFNEFSGYKGTNEIIHAFVSDDQYNTDFSKETSLDYKWIIDSPYTVISGGVWLKCLTGPESLYSKFSVDGDFTIDVFYSGFNNYSSGEAKIRFGVVFKKDLQFKSLHITHCFINNYISTVHTTAAPKEINSDFCGLRIKRVGSVVCFYYRMYGTAWDKAFEKDEGYDYIYPVNINVYVYGDNSFDLKIEKILVTKGTGIADTDLMLLESLSLSTLFVRGRQFSDNNTYAISSNFLMTKTVYPFSFSWLGSVSSSISEGGILVEKPYDLGLTYEEKDLSLWWFSEYFTSYKIEDVLSYSSDVNTISSVSVGDYNVNENLFTDTSDKTIKAIYKARYGVNTIIDETFKKGEGTFDTVFSGSGLTEYMSDDFTGNDGDLYNQTLWSGSVSNIEIKDNKLHMFYCDDYVYVDTKYTPVNDFNVQTDFSIETYQTSNYWSQGLVVCFGNGDSFSISFKCDTTGSPDYCYAVTTYIEGVSTDLCFYTIADLSGELRITKKENIFSSYFLQNDKWLHLIDWELTADTVVSGIRLEHRSWNNNPDFECYFDNFVINDDFDFYSDVFIDGDYSHVDGNYIKLSGGVVRSNKAIRLTNAFTFECSVTIEDYGYPYSFGLTICNKPFRSVFNDSSSKVIYIYYSNGVFKLIIDGGYYSYIHNNAGQLFSLVYGQPYIIGVKFIPGTGTIIYWEGPTNGYLVLDYIMSGDLYVWCGNVYGKGIYRDQVTTVHRFRCFEDKILYKELKNDWIQSVGADDAFNASEGSSPNSERWAIEGSPKIHNNSLKLVSTNEDKIQSKVFFCAPFEIILDYNNLLFSFIEGLALSLNIEAYGSYKDTMFGVSKFKVGYSGGVAAWVNYYCSDSSGNSSIYHISDASNRKLKIINDGYNIQYLLSDGAGWITILSQECVRQYYYKVSVEGTDQDVIAYLDSITVNSEEFMTPTDAVALVPTAWKFSPTNKAYQDITYINLNELIDRCRHFSIDVVAKIDDSMFLSYIEMDKDLVNFDGAKVVGGNYITLTSAMDAASDGEVIYVLPGTYDIGGYIITKNIIIVGVGDYNDIIITINGDSVNIYGSEVIFKNITMINQLPVIQSAGFKIQGDDISYFTMDGCKYSCLNGNVVVFRGEGTREYYVYLRHSYLYFQSTYMLVNIYNPYQPIILDIFNCRIPYSENYMLFLGLDQYQIRSEIYDNRLAYEPKVINTIPVFVLFSPHGNTNIYLNTPKGLEKTITSKENEFNYLSFGNSPGGAVFYGGNNDYYFSEYFMPPVDDSFKLFIQGYIDTIRVFDRYQTYYETLNNINIVDNLGIDLKLAHNNTIMDYKTYEPLNQYNSNLELGRNTSSIIDEFIWSKTVTSSSNLLKYYNNYLEKLGVSSCNIQTDSAKFKFFIDFGSNIGVGSLIQSISHNFTNTVCYSDNVSDPALLDTACSLSEARWYSLYNSVSQHVSNLTPGKFSVFPSISGCDASRWEYTGERGYIDVLPGSVLSVSSSLNDVYNIKWKRNKTSIDEYFVSSFSGFLTVSLRLFGGGTCKRIEIKSGYDIGIEFAGYITKCSILIDGVSCFSVDNNVNSTITADIGGVSFSTIDIVIEEVKQVSNFVFNDTMLTGNAVFINYVKVLSESSSRAFNNTLCNIYEFNSSTKLGFVDTSKIGICSLDYYHSGQYSDGCITTTIMDLDNLPNSEVVSILAKSDNLYDCGFAINEYVVDIVEESMTGSIESWKVYIGDVELYEEFFYLQGVSTSVGFKFFKETVFEVGTHYEDFGTNIEWAITDELVLNIYASNPISSFYICIGNKTDGIYYRWGFSLAVGWNNLRFNFYDAYVTKYSFNVLTERLLFNDLAIFNVWCGGVYQHGDGFVVLDNVFVDKSSAPNTLSSHKDAFYIPVSFESESGSIHIDYVTYWGNDGVIFGDMLSDKTILSVFGDELCFSLINKISGKFVLGVYSYKYNVRTVKVFGKAQKFDINDTIKLRLDWSCRGNQFFSDLYVNGSFTGRTLFNLVETSKLKVTGIMVGGGSVYITSIYNSLSLCGQLKYIKVYSSNVESKLINDRLLIKHDGNYKNLVDNSPLYVGEIQPSDYVTLPIKYEGKSKELNQLNLKVKWVGIY